jgi:hypothetical protein
MRPLLLLSLFATHAFALTPERQQIPLEAASPDPKLAKVVLIAGPVPDKNRTTPDAKSHSGRDEVMAWAYERAGGGRSFAFTGCDLHRNWGVESQRRFVINGILWAAGLEVPAHGAKVPLDPADLTKWWDDKPKPAPKAKAAPAPAQ